MDVPAAVAAEVFKSSSLLEVWAENSDDLCLGKGGWGASGLSVGEGSVAVSKRRMRLFRYASRGSERRFVSIAAPSNDRRKIRARFDLGMYWRWRCAVLRRSGGSGNELGH